MDEKEALKVDSRRACTCLRELKSIELPGYSSLPTSHFSNPGPNLPLLLNYLSVKVADTLVIIDEMTDKLNWAVCWGSFIFAIKWSSPSLLFTVHFTATSERARLC